MRMCKFTEYSPHYSETTGSLWFYSKDEATIVNTNMEDYNAFNSFKYKAKLLGNIETDGDNGILKNTAIADSLKYLSKFWKDHLKCH